MSRGPIGVVVAGAFAVALSSGCGGSTQVSFVSNERPSAQGAPHDALPNAAHAENPNVLGDLPNDEEIIEPEHPAVDTKQERALVHIHTPTERVCSGVVLGPRLIATAQRCLRGEPRGVSAVASNHAYKVEIASSTLTWTTRRASHLVIPACEPNELDIGLLVLSEPAEWVQPLRIVSAPGTGATVQALGFGRCTGVRQSGQKQSMKQRTGAVRSRTSASIVIDMPLCKGDAGGPVVDGRDGDVIGLISHRDNPEGSPLLTTAIARLDTTQARDLIAQANTLIETGDAAKLSPVSCK